MTYIVVNYSWDKYPQVFPCNTQEKAKATLRALYEKEVRIEKEENKREEGTDFTHSIDDDGFYAKITVFCVNTDDTTEWAIAM